MPERIPVDRELLDPHEAAEAVESLRSDGGLLRSATHIAAVHSLYYPAYVVEYGYQKTTGVVRKSTTTERDEFLVDGMDIGHTKPLQQYHESATSPTQGTVGVTAAEPDPPGHFGDPIVLEPELSQRDAEMYLASKLEEIDELVDEKREEIRERVKDLEMQGQGTAANKQAKQLDNIDGEELYADLRELLNLPPGFTEETFAGVSHTEKVYLPFWVVRIHRESGRGDQFVAFREMSSSLTSGVEPVSVDWVSDWFMNDVNAADLLRE